MVPREVANLFEGQVFAVGGRLWVGDIAQYLPELVDVGVFDGEDQLLDDAVMRLLHRNPLRRRTGLVRADVLCLDALGSSGSGNESEQHE